MFSCDLLAHQVNAVADGEPRLSGKEVTDPVVDTSNQATTVAPLHAGCCDSAEIESAPHRAHCDSRSR
jgi:hypothetical protein